MQEQLRLVKQGYSTVQDQLLVKQANQAVREQVLEHWKGRLSGTCFRHEGSQIYCYRLEMSFVTGARQLSSCYHHGYGRFNQAFAS